jgi:hypothetical protein
LTLQSGESKEIKSTIFVHFLSSANDHDGKACAYTYIAFPKLDYRSLWRNLAAVVIANINLFSHSVRNGGAVGSRLARMLQGNRGSETCAE